MVYPRQTSLRHPTTNQLLLPFLSAYVKKNIACSLVLVTLIAVAQVYYYYELGVVDLAPGELSILEPPQSSSVTEALGAPGSLMAFEEANELSAPFDGVVDHTAGHVHMRDLTALCPVPRPSSISNSAGLSRLTW